MMTEMTTIMMTLKINSPVVGGVISFMPHLSTMQFARSSPQVGGFTAASRAAMTWTKMRTFAKATTMMAERARPERMPWTMKPTSR